MDGFSEPNRTESDADRMVRIARENAIIDEAERRIAAGLGIDFEDARHWLVEDATSSFPQPSGRVTVPDRS